MGSRVGDPLPPGDTTPVGTADDTPSGAKSRGILSANALTFATARLRVSHWQADLANPAARARLEAELDKLLTPAVMAHLPPSVQRQGSPGDIPIWIAARHDHGAEVATVVADNTLVGLVFAFFPDPDAEDLHIGYLFGEAAWGQGFATEMVAGLLHNLQQLGHCGTVHAGVDPKNTASVRVLEKAGFKRTAGQTDVLKFAKELTTPSHGV